MDNMIVDWKLWSNKREESDIMMKFADKARMYTLIYTCRTCLYFIPLKYSTFSIFLFVSSVHIHCRYIIYSYNVCTTRNGCNRPFKRKSYHGTSILLSISVIVAADTQLMVFSCHVSGLFAIVG